MLEKPAVPDETIAALLAAEFGLEQPRLAFLPIGADPHSAVYRADAAGGQAYFLKLRTGNFDEALTAVPRFLHGLGIREVIPPLLTRSGGEWAALGDFRLILYPFIAGQDGSEVELTREQWLAFGAALRRMHDTQLPPALERLLARESYSPRWRGALQNYMAQAAAGGFDDPTAAQQAAFLLAHRHEVEHLLARAGELAAALRANPPALALCHSDIHAWNVIVSAQQAENEHSGLYIVDWDNPILAPKERDLMFIGAGLNPGWDTPRAQELFYQGYAPGEGQAAVNRAALAYYRFERIVEDLAVECEQVFSGAGSAEDREQAFEFLMSNFQPGGTLEAALRAGAEAA